MPTIADLKQSKFLTKSDVTPPVLGTIRGYEQLNVAMEGAPQEMKYSLHFNELEKPLVLNSTNGQIIAGIFKSDDFDAWIGKTIVLYFDPNVSFGGKLTGGIRVRAVKEGAKLPQQTAAPEPTDDCPF